MGSFDTVLSSLKATIHNLAANDENLVTFIEDATLDYTANNATDNDPKPTCG